MLSKMSMDPDTEIDVKRFYIPGVVLDQKCPGCGSDCSKDLGNNYLSFPRTGTNQVNFYCRDCHEEWSMDIDLSVTVTVLGGDGE